MAEPDDAPDERRNARRDELSDMIQPYIKRMIDPVYDAFERQIDPDEAGGKERCRMIPVFKPGREASVEWRLMHADRAYEAMAYKKNRKYLKFCNAALELFKIGRAHV